MKQKAQSQMKTPFPKMVKRLNAIALSNPPEARKRIKETEEELTAGLPEATSGEILGMRINW